MRGDSFIAQSRNSVFGEKVFYCEGGRRRWIRSVEDIHRLGFRWPTDLKFIEEQVLGAFQNGGSVPQFDRTQAILPSRHWGSLTMRDYAGAPLSGLGLEIGAGASPYPVPLDCRVLYGDRFTPQEIEAHRYRGQNSLDLVVPDLVVDFNNLDGVPDNFFDFIVGCHVIEHLFDPVGAIAAAYQKLKKGGYLLLVVPEMTRTFDKKRPLTTIEHLMEDYKSPGGEKDKQHYQEFYSLSFPVAPENIDSVVAEKFSERSDIHYHVWDYDGFSALIDTILEKIAPFRARWSHPALADKTNDIEFYFRLQK